METQNTYYATLTSYGLEFVQNNLSGGGKFIAEGWYIALGIGDTNPSLETKDLANRIYDKYSDGYPGIRIENDPEIGRAAYIQAPRSLQGNIITEMGLFDNEDNLIMSAKTFIDMTKGFEYGLNKVFDIGISLVALPADVELVIVNPPSAYPTYEQVTNQLKNYQLLEQKSKPNGYASLNEKGIVPDEQLPPPISLENCANIDLSNLTEAGLNLIKGNTTFATEGKCLLPGGLLIQWGQKIGFNSITFPQKFSVLYGIYTTVITSEACVACPITDASVSGFYLRNATHGGRHDDRPGLNNYWMAIGKA